MSSAEATRRRVLRATLACFEKHGIARTSLEDVAAEAGLSRATVYRHFPGGREQVVTETVTWEAGNFLGRIGAALVGETGLEDKLRAALTIGHRAIGEHRLLQQILSTEPSELLRELANAEPLLIGAVRGYVTDLLPDRLPHGVDRAETADYLARLYLSYIGSPGRWDLDDPEQVERLVRTQFLAGVVGPAAAR